MLIHEYNYAGEKKINHGKLIFFYFYLKNSFLKGIGYYISIKLILSNIIFKYNLLFLKFVLILIN